jgi:DNA-directed RNA polymerase subunit RPC12/RpoP
MDASHRIVCPRCSYDRVRRVYRKGPLQKFIYPLFGYYPWRCTRCGKKLMLRLRNLEQTA